MQVKAKAVKSKYGVWLLVITCPYCGKKHTHGGGDGIKPSLYGFRAPHCYGDKLRLEDYELIPE